MGATKEQWLSAAIAGYVREHMRDTGTELYEDDVFWIVAEVEGAAINHIRELVEEYGREA